MMSCYAVSCVDSLSDDIDEVCRPSTTTTTNTAVEVAGDEYDDASTTTTVVVASDDNDNDTTITATRPTTAAEIASEEQEDDDIDEVCVYSRPDRPDCVPKIDLSWATDDEKRTTRHAPHHHTTNPSPNQQLRHRHVTSQDGGQPEVVARRRRRRRRRCNDAKRHRYHYAAAAGAFADTPTPITPPAPRQQIVHHNPRHSDTKEDEVEMNAAVHNCNDCGCTTTASRDAISACDVTVGNARTMQHAHPTDDVITRQTGSNIAEGLNANCISPLSNPARSEAECDEIVRCDGGDAVQEDAAELKAESSSASLAQRLMYSCGCCSCCLMTLTFNRSAPKQS